LSQSFSGGFPGFFPWEWYSPHAHRTRQLADLGRQRAQLLSHVVEFFLAFLFSLDCRLNLQE